MWNLKNYASELIYITEIDTENRLMATKWNSARRDKLGVWD